MPRRPVAPQIRDGVSPPHSWISIATAGSISSSGSTLNYSIAGNVVCYSVSGQRDYCPPSAYRARPSHLFRNNRDGTFSDITAAAGMATEFGPALGISTADFNRDGWIDLYVANDGAPNQLWINQRNGTFRNTRAARGCGGQRGRTAQSQHGR